MVKIFDFGVCKTGTIPIWGFPEGYNFDMGVHEYQKVENSCTRKIDIVETALCDHGYCYHFG
jgi:hypothetical protein